MTQKSSSMGDSQHRKKFKLNAKTLNVSSAADASKGPRDTMEDTHTIRDDLKFYGVYDGHGGEEAATILQQIEEAISEAFSSVDKHVLQESQANKWDSGTTAVVALIHGTKLYVANCGDSEAVLGRTKLHKKTRIRRNPDSSTPTPTLQESPAPRPPINTIMLDPLSPLADSLGISPTSVLSHLSLASPRFPSRISSLCSEVQLDSINESEPTDTPAIPTNGTPSSITSPTLTLTSSISRVTETNQSNPANQTDQNAQATQATVTDSAINVHKRTHSDPNKEDNEDVDGEEDGEDWEEWEEDPGDTLTADIETYLKENPNSFFCHEEGQCGVFEPVVVSNCHRPTCEEEVKRIDAAGGNVSYGRVLGELGITRAFGDINYKHPHNKGKADFVSVQPHIKVIDLQPNDEFLIMASDGLWDVVSHKEAVDVISKSKSARDSHQACEDLVDEALRKNSFDNVTVLFLSFQWSSAK